MRLLYDLVAKIVVYRISYFEMKWGTFPREDSKDGGIGTAKSGNVGEGQSSITESKYGKSSAKAAKAERRFHLGPAVYTIMLQGSV